MADSDDSGVIVLNDDVRLVKYQKYVVICKSCLHVLFSKSQSIRREENWTAFPIDAITVKFDAMYLEWHCRNCNAVLSENVPTDVVSTQFNQGLCILSHENTYYRFATFEMTDLLANCS